MTVYECPDCGTVIETETRDPFGSRRVRCYHSGDGDYADMERLGSTIIGGPE